MLRIRYNHLIMFTIIGFAIWTLSGMFDFSVGIASNGKVAMGNPVISAFSPVALMLCIFGFVGVWLLIDAARNFKLEKEELAKRQVTTGFIVLLVIFGMYELLIRVPLLL